MSSGAMTMIFAVLAAAPAAIAQPAPPAMPEAPSSPAAAEAKAASPVAERAAPPPALSDLLSTRVEQVRRGNRVSEVRVVGGDGEVRYTMENREGVAPPSPQNSKSGLSTPSFIRIEF